ncbi:hypothetical protein ACIGCM_03060 [Pseudomonas sp. NPDC078700]|uniref:hypothetical protein n=1 Tax=Pseudomonas sp. NPDC078700 TaxID=3364424 RepID=UPI0037C9752E
MKLAHYLCLSTLCLTLTGCISFTPAGPIGLSDQLAPKTLPRAAMIDDVVISDMQINNDLRITLSRQFTEQLSNRIEQGEYFKQVLSFPAKLGEDDVMLKFNFSSLKGKRTPHPAYFPGALLTLTVWIWVNGPIYVDKYDLAGELSITDAQGKVLTDSKKVIKRDENIGAWDDDYFTTTLGSVQVNELVEQLIQDSTEQLAKL